MRVISLHGAPEESEDQWIIGVMPQIPDRYILKQTAVCTQDVVHPESDLFSPEKHDTGPSILSPFSVARE